MRRLVALCALVALAGCGENSYNIDEPQTVEDLIAATLSGVSEGAGLSDRQDDTYWSCVEPLIPDIRSKLPAELVVQMEQALEVAKDDPDGTYPTLEFALGQAALGISLSDESSGCLQEAMGMGGS